MNVALILAGGKGTRMGIADQPKQFIDIYGKPLIIHTLESFDRHVDIDYIAVSCLEPWKEDLRIWIRKYEINKVKWIVDGGESRQESVYNGINTISEELCDNDVVLVHDSARPLLSHRIISDNIEAAKLYGAADTVIPATDTIIKSVDSEIITDVPKRKELYLGQTPQSFKLSVIKDAHSYSKKHNIMDATDDCQLALKAGYKVHLVKGDNLNFKITTLEDLLLLKSMIKMSKLEMV
jgi:D-ribitol-5-phosphate cytidylyltransferase